MTFDDIKLYLPKYLSAEAEKELYSSLKGFPQNLNERFYSNWLKKEKTIFQGDNIYHLPIVNLPDVKTKLGNCMIISNTSDIDPDNKRYFGSQILYAPVFKLSKYENILKQKSIKSKAQIENHVKSIKNQFVTQVFYLPKYGNKMEESIVFLDRILNIPLSYIKNFDPLNDRLFSLSNYGFYLLVLKLSIHFSRVQEKVERE